MAETGRLGTAFVAGPLRDGRQAPTANAGFNGWRK